MAETLYALSIKQPWAALLVAGRKTIEVRSWNSPRRGRILIHAAGKPDEREEAWRWVTEDIRPLTKLSGGIIGIGELVEVRHYTSAEQFNTDMNLHLNDPSWYQENGLFGFVFQNIEARPFRRLPGNVRFFSVEAEGLA